MTSTPAVHPHWRRNIDFVRLERLQREPPADPISTGGSLSRADSRGLGCRDLVVWEQVNRGEELYIPPCNCYEIYLRLAVSSPVVQWREGVLDVRRDALGEVVAVRPHQAAYFRTAGPGLNLHMSVRPELLWRAAGNDKPASVVRLRNSFGEHDPVIAGLGRLLLDYAKTPGSHARAFFESAGTALAVRLLERFGLAPPAPAGRLTTAQLARIDEYLNSDLSERVSLEHMAALVELSPHAFYRAFKATTGVPPLRYSLQQRMGRARALVEGTRKPIGDIASEVGFPDLAHFSTTFRKHWGCPPSALRRP